MCNIEVLSLFALNVNQIDGYASPKDPDRQILISATNALVEVHEMFPFIF
jgi:hypothetical protein